MDIERLFKLENLFPEDFANTEIRPYGKLFYNQAIPDSYDSNHAVIFDLSYDLARAIADIKSFYLSKDLTPRIYQSFQKEEAQVLFPILEKQGFTISQQPDRLFVWQPEAASPALPDCSNIKNITAVEPSFVSFVISEYKSPRMAEVIKRHLLLKNFHQFAYFEDGRPVATASLNLMEGFSRIDDVLTDAAYRNRGFATRLVDHIIKFHSRRSDNILYLFASNPAAIKVYKKQGFAEFDMDRMLWSAWLEQA